MRGTTLIEVVLVVGLIAVLSSVLLLNLVGRKSTTELDAAVRQIAALLREARSRSVAQSSSTSWGVHFENSTATAPFYSLFGGTYSTSSRIGYYRLPVPVGYATTSIALGATKEITFTQITGAASASTSLQMYLLGDPSVSSTIRVASSGMVSY